MTEQGYSPDTSSDSRAHSEPALERERLALDLQNRISRLNEQARIFLPLIALGLIVAIPIWSRSLVRFLILLASPFVLLPIGFCLIHLILAWRGIARVRFQLREDEQRREQIKSSDR
jgi:hypothetical protein